MQKIRATFRANASMARRLWGEQSRFSLGALRALTTEYSFSVRAGDLQLVDGKWYVTHTGLLRLASNRRCRGIITAIQRRLCSPLENRWVFRAVVFKDSKSKGFVGYGDADPSNVSSRVHGAEMRVAETRAVNRALRKAYGIGLCSIDELGAVSTSTAVPAGSTSASGIISLNGNGAGQPRLRDQLCVLIRKFKLDPNQVKRYAADFCGTDSLNEASRESVQAFINHLNKAAEENRDALVCKLNSFAPRVEVQS